MMDMFLIGVALIWTIFAVVQDFKTEEVANWLSFSLIGIGICYRAFYSAIFSDWGFLIFGLLGLVLFVVFGYCLYYAKAIGGGDAKLLMGYGLILPYSGYLDVLVAGVGFVLLLFVAGLVWSLLYSVKIVLEDSRKFKKFWGEELMRFRVVLFIAIVMGMIGLFWINGWIFGLFIVILTLIFVYVKALDNCMVVLRGGKDLMEGDWIVKDVRVGKNLIKQTVHGLSTNDIKILKKAGKKVKVKRGIPFTPAFLISLLIMVFWGEVLLALAWRIFSLL